MPKNVCPVQSDPVAHERLLAPSSTERSDQTTSPIRVPGGDARMRPTVKIREIRAVGLFGATPEGGWSNELRPEDSVHTLISVLTDEGAVGYGGVFTNAGLVQSALAVLEPLYRGENALEPERVSEKLHQNTFWLGRGGSIKHLIIRIAILVLGRLRQAKGETRRPVPRGPGRAGARPRPSLRQGR